MNRLVVLIDRISSERTGTLRRRRCPFVGLYKSGNGKLGGTADFIRPMCVARGTFLRV